MTTEVDLRQLVFDREQVRPPIRTHRRPWLSRYVFRGVIIAGFLAMIAWAARDWVVPSKVVTVVPVVISRVETQQAGTALFQTAGWIEPRPTPVLASALAEGIVEQLLVVEGQSVEAGQP